MMSTKLVGRPFSYEHADDWVKECLESGVSQRRKVERKGMHKWFETAVFDKQTEDDVSGVIKKKAGTLKLRVESKKGKGWSQKDTLEVKMSTVKMGECGLFALVRFEKGMVVTVVFGEDKKSQGFLAVGGNIVQKLKGEALYRCNAIVTSNGVIRAIQRIMPGQEIVVEDDPERFHPVMLLDALVTKTASNVTCHGRVTSYSGNRDGEVLYSVAFDDGSVEKVSTQHIINFYGRGKKN